MSIEKDLLEILGKYTPEEIAAAVKAVADRLDKPTEPEKPAGDMFLEHPKVGEKYFGATPSGSIFEATWRFSDLDIYTFDYQPIFRTREACYREIDRQKAETKIRLFNARINQGWKPDWSNTSEIKWTLFADCDLGDIEFFNDDHVTIVNSPSGMHTNRELSEDEFAEILPAYRVYYGID